MFIWQESERIDESGESKERGCVAGLVDKCFDLAIYGVKKCSAAGERKQSSLFSSHQKIALYKVQTLWCLFLMCTDIGINMVV